MSNINFTLHDATDDDGVLLYPVVFWRDKISIFARPSEGDFPHRFGGTLPDQADLPLEADLHALLRIDTLHCEALQGLPTPSLPLIYPFRHDGAQFVYQWDDPKLTVEKLSPKKPTKDWPYENFPSTLPITTMGSSAAFAMSRENFEQLMWQGAYDVPESSVIVVIPPREDYGVSLWGEYGDAEGVQCVFIYDPETGMIRAENQCS